MTTSQILFHNSIVRGALTGFAAAAMVDVHTFLAWKKVQDFATWDWRTALMRWIQGTIYGALTGVGFVMTPGG